MRYLHTYNNPQQTPQDDQTRGGAATALADACARFLSVVNSDDAAHLSEEERSTVRTECDNALKWLQDKQGLQAQVAKSEPAVLTTADIVKKQDVVARVCTPITTKPAPAPPKVEEPKAMDTDVQEGDEAAGAEGEDTAGTAAGEAQAGKEETMEDAA